MNKIRFGVIGCGYIANKSFIPALIESDSVELIAISSRQKTKSKTLSKKYNCSYENDYNALINRKDIDVIYIATVPSTHEDIIISSAENGKHVICEKPLTTSKSSAKRVVDVCNRNNVAVFEGFMYQFHNQHKKVRDIVKEKQIGKPILFSASFGFPPMDDANYRYKYELGGGALLDAGSYTIHAARKFFNREPVNIYSSIYSNGKTVDIHGTVMLDFDKGQTAHLSFGFNNYYRNTYSIWGTEGYIEVKRSFSIPPDQSAKILLQKKNNKEIILCNQDNHFLNQINYFCDSLNNKFLRKKWSIDIINQAIIYDKILKNNI